MGGEESILAVAAGSVAWVVNDDPLGLRPRGPIREKPAINLQPSGSVSPEAKSPVVAPLPPKAGTRKESARDGTVRKRNGRLGDSSLQRRGLSTRPQQDVMHRLSTTLTLKVGREALNRRKLEKV